MLEFLFVLMSQAAVEAPTAPAQELPGVAVAAPPSAPDPQDVVRCRFVPVTGSLIGARRCTTPRQDRQAREEARRQTQEMQRLLHDAQPSPVHGTDPQP